jgi:hypothetical protein
MTVLTPYSLSESKSFVSSSFWFAVDRVLELGQSKLTTVASQAALNSRLGGVD